MMKTDYTIVLGGGESGLWSALLAHNLGHRVLLSDKGFLSKEAKEYLQSKGIPFEEGGHRLQELEQATCVIKSPGIHSTAPVVQRCLALNIPVISEIEFASLYLNPKSKIIAITGSNGKTTTTTLIDYLLRACGCSSVACGNIGKSLASCAMEPERDFYVVELSSFQLDHMYQTRVDVSLLLNITPDHLDRYEYSLEKYSDAKGRIFRNQRASDTAIVNLDDLQTRSLLQRQTTFAPFMAQQHTFSLQSEKATAYYKDGLIHLTMRGGKRVSYDYSSMPLNGEHNAANIMAALLALNAVGIDKEFEDGTILQALQAFHGIEHRMELVKVHKGVRYINDSKATNIDSTQYALGAMDDHKTILLIGGTDKGNDYSVILPLVKAKCKALIYLTTDSVKLHHYFDSLKIPTFEARGMDEAFSVIKTMNLEEGDTVLLSPACASFDLFKNYEHRGTLFKQAVSDVK